MTRDLVKVKRPKKVVFPFPKDACIVNVATESYAEWQQIMVNSINKYGEGIPVLAWRGQLPKGSPLHGGMPYAFKAYAIKEALDQGFKKILWLDTSMYMINYWGDFWDELGKRGALFWECDTGATGFWCGDSAMNLLGKTREELFNIPLMQGGVFAFDFSDAKARKIWEFYWHHVHSGALLGLWRKEHGFVSKDSRVHGHRHDMPILSVACADNDMALVPQPYLFSYPIRIVPTVHTCISCNG